MDAPVGRTALDLVAGFHRMATFAIPPNLEGLTDEEYRWEPVDDCWSIRPRDEIRSPDAWGAGPLVVETSFDGTVEPTMTTIAWRLVHAYDCLRDYTSRAFGGPPLPWDTVPVPATAALAVAQLLDALDDLGARCADPDLDDGVLVGGDSHDGRPRTAALAAGLFEVAHHCAEVGVLRRWFASVQDPSGPIHSGPTERDRG